NVVLVVLDMCHRFSLSLSLPRFGAVLLVDQNGLTDHRRCGARPVPNVQRRPIPHRPHRPLHTLTATLHTLSPRPLAISRARLLRIYPLTLKLRSNLCPPPVQSQNRGTRQVDRAPQVGHIAIGARKTISRPL